MSEINRTNKIHVGNIPKHVPFEEVRRLVGPFGSVQQCDQVSGKTEDWYGATVTYETQDQAQQAFTKLNGYEFEGSFLKIDFVMDRGHGQPNNNNRIGGRGEPRNMGFPCNNFPLRILVLSDMVGAIIGRGGRTIRQITQQSRARVDVQRTEWSCALEKDQMYFVQVISIYGNPENCSTACQKVLETMQQEANNRNRGEIQLEMLVYNNFIGRIIGKNGNTINRIMEKTDSKITVSSSIDNVSSFNLERIITVKGKLENICAAEQLISKNLHQSYENDLAAMAPHAMMFPGLHPMIIMSTMGNSTGGYLPNRGGPLPLPYGMYNAPPQYNMPMMAYSPPPPQNMVLQKETVYLYIPNSAVGAIIGPGGSTIRDMMSSSGATIEVAQASKDKPGDRQTERKVTIVGVAESQWRAQFMIFKKIRYESYADPLQDSRLKVEIYIPSTQVRRIIGKGGQTVRELERQSNAIIKLPEETDTGSDAEEIPVHIIGDFYSTHVAQRQIRALVKNSQLPPQPGMGVPPNNRQVQAN